MAKASNLFNYIPKADGGATILLYGDVGQWGEVTSQRVVAELLALEGQYSTIDVRINSTGGDVFTGIAIFNALRQSKANITIYIDGIAASIAGVIALCGKPLYMSQYAQLMLHKVSGGAYGSAKELRETAELIESLEESLTEMISGRIGKIAKEVHDIYFADGADHWLTAREALALGFIDGIHDLPEEPSLSEQSTTEEIYQVFNNKWGATAPNNPNNQDMTLLEQIRTVASFQNATEGNVVSLLREQAAKLEHSEKTIAELQARLAEQEQKELESIVNVAVSDGRISEAQKPHYLNLLAADRASAEAVLGSLPKSAPKGGQFPSAKQYTQPSASGAAGKFQGKTWNELDRAGLLPAFKEQDPEGFANAYKVEFGEEYKF